jgi:hypothetical protein
MIHCTNLLCTVIKLSLSALQGLFNSSFLQILLYTVPETDVPVYSYLGSSLAKYVWNINRIMVSNIKSLPLQTKYTPSLPNVIVLFTAK